MLIVDGARGPKRENTYSNLSLTRYIDKRWNTERSRIMILGPVCKLRHRDILKSQELQHTHDKTDAPFEMLFFEMLFLPFVESNPRQKNKSQVVSCRIRPNCSLTSCHWLVAGRLVWPPAGVHCCRSWFAARRLLLPLIRRLQLDSRRRFGCCPASDDSALSTTGPNPLETW